MALNLAPFDRWMLPGGKNGPASQLISCRTHRRPVSFVADRLQLAAEVLIKPYRLRLEAGELAAA